MKSFIDKSMMKNLDETKSIPTVSADELLGIGDNDVEHTCLIWLDGSADVSSENRATQTQFRAIVHHFKTFTNVSDCEKFIRSKSNFDRVYLISSGIFGQDLIPRLTALRQLCFAYVYCRDKQRNEKWSKNFAKIKGVFVGLDPLMQQIRLDHSKRLQSKVDEPFPFHIGKNDSKFIYSQILFDCLVQMKSLATDRTEFVEFCQNIYENNLCEIDVIKNFEEKYSSQQSIWWLTRDCSISRIFLKILTNKNLKNLFQCAFFLRDLHEILQKNRLQSSIQLFYGQILSMNELHQFKNSIGDYFILNRFLSANLHRQKVLDTLKEFPKYDDSIRVLFEIEADPKVNPKKPFANITPFTYTATDQLVLFMIGSIFRIHSIHFEDKSHTWIIKVTFSNLGKDYNACNLLSCGQILLEQFNAFDQAEIYFQRLVKETAETHLDIYFSSQALAHIYFNQCNYDLSLKWYNRALKVAIFHGIHLSRTYFHLGCTFQKIGRYDDALDAYQSALKHWDEQLRPDESNLIGDCWNNLGCVYEYREFYSKAMECHQHARKLREDFNLNLGSSFNNIANVYLAIGEFKSALEHYEFALEAKKKMFPYRHETIGTTLANIALVCECDRNWQKALQFYTAAASIFSELFPSFHLFNVNIKESLERVSQLAAFQSTDLSSETIV